jgi:hypothetical protein
MVVAHNYFGKGIGCPASQANGTLLGIKVTPGQPPTPAVTWCAAAPGRGSAAVSTTDGNNESIVWVVGSETDNRLRGFNGDNGAVIFSGGGQAEAMGRVRRFQAPIIAGGRLYVAGDDQVYAFKVN